MKLTYAIAAALLASSPTAFAIPIGTVGGADTLVKWASLDDSSDAAEKQMIAEYLNVDAD